MCSVITAVPMHLSRFFQLKSIVRWVFRGAKKPDSIHSLSIPTITYYIPYLIIIFPLTGSGGKEDAAIAIMHTLSYMIAFTCFVNSHFVIVYEVLYFQ